MFNLLKEKLKKSISKLSEGIEKESIGKESIGRESEEDRGTSEKDAPEKKGFFSRLKEKFTAKKEEDKGIYTEIEDDSLIKEGYKEEAQETEKKEKQKPSLKDIPFAKSIPGLKEIEQARKKERDAEEKTQESHESHPPYRPAHPVHNVVDTPIEPQQKKEIKDKNKKDDFNLIDRKIKAKLDSGKAPSLDELTERKLAREKENLQINRSEIKNKIEQREEKHLPHKEETEKGEVEQEETSFFGKIKQKITTKKISSEKFDEIFWDLESTLLENNVAVEVIEKMKDDMKLALVEKPIRRGHVEEVIVESLKNTLEEVFNQEKINLLQKIKNKSSGPFIICFIGINGSGKTTTIAKVANLLKDNNLSCVIAAADTFRAAAIQQLEEHAENLGVKLIKHDYGSDPAAVAFDAIKHAEAKKINAVLIDTAGRLHSNENLMDEMKKIIRIAKPDLKIFVGEAITGNDCIEQAKEFNDAVGIDAIILSKADIDEKGGASISVSYVTQKPIIYIGTGQEYADLREFDQKLIIDSLGLSS